MNTEWYRTEGEEPDDVADYDYIWIHWISGHIELAENLGYIAWHETTHWMPTDITEPDEPDDL